MEYLDENPIDEVYRIRLQNLKEYGGMKGYNEYLRKNKEKFVKMGFRFVNKEEVFAVLSENVDNQAMVNSIAQAKIIHSDFALDDRVSYFDSLHQLESSSQTYLAQDYPGRIAAQWQGLSGEIGPSIQESVATIQQSGEAMAQGAEQQAGKTSAAVLGAQKSTARAQVQQARQACGWPRSAV